MKYVIATLVFVTVIASVNFFQSGGWREIIDGEYYEVIAYTNHDDNTCTSDPDKHGYEFEAKQKVEQAKAEAEAIRIQAEAITQQGGADYVRLKAIEKWQGNVPTTMIPDAAIPFVGKI